MYTLASQRKQESREKQNLSLTYSPVGLLIKTQTKWYLTTQSLPWIVIGSGTSAVSVVHRHNKNVMANTCSLSQTYGTIYISDFNTTAIAIMRPFYFKLSFCDSCGNVIWNAIRWETNVCARSTYVAKTSALKRVQKVDPSSVLCSHQLSNWKKMLKAN